MLSQFLNEHTIAVQQRAKDKYEAIRIAGRLLVDQSFVKAAYIDEMIASLDSLGPYIVLSKGIAFAHARPGELVLRDCTSLITLATPVPFGHKKNDPVQVLFVLAARETGAHMSVMRGISKLICREDFFEAMSNASDTQTVVRYIQSADTASEVRAY